jgi:hypothetical protein
MTQRRDPIAARINSITVLADGLLEMIKDNHCYRKAETEPLRMMIATAAICDVLGRLAVESHVEIESLLDGVCQSVRSRAEPGGMVINRLSDLSRN